MVSNTKIPEEIDWIEQWVSEMNVNPLPAALKESRTEVPSEGHKRPRLKFTSLFSAEKPSAEGRSSDKSRGGEDV